MTRPRLLLLCACLPVATAAGAAAQDSLVLNEREYFHRPGVDVMVFSDFYPEGHQSGVSVVQHGLRVATGGDVRLEDTPGQWSPVPRQVDRTVDAEAGEIRARLAFPDPERDRRGFNPIEYPELQLAYTVRAHADGPAVIVSVDLDAPLPEPWVGRVGFNLELFPAALFGHAWQLGGRSGLFPPQPIGPVAPDGPGGAAAVPLARGPRLVVAPDAPAQRLTIESETEPLALFDGRVNHQNGWFVVRSLVPAGATRDAVRWRLTPDALGGWHYGPVVHVSQVGYHPAQAKVAVIESDPDDAAGGSAALLRFAEDGSVETALEAEPADWGPFLRFRYARFDFSSVEREGVYAVEYRGVRSEPFRIASDVYQRDVWQPTLEYFLPVQMCHVRVEEKYRVWHGLCHMDDARMAPPDLNHFDGYLQGPSTLTRFQAFEPVPGLDQGGWHDAGDDDLRIESQAGEMYVLALIQETFGVDLDSTRVDEAARRVGIREPDGVPDILQQIAHGARHVLGGYRALGRLYRGVISPTLRQYVMVGDVSNQTDGRVETATPEERAAARPGSWDDRLVFTEDNPRRELTAAAYLAASGRVLRALDPDMADECVRTAAALWERESPPEAATARVHAAVELLLATGEPRYRAYLLENRDLIVGQIGRLGWLLGRVLPRIDDSAFTEAVRGAVAAREREAAAEREATPFGVPYRPVVWGAGWGIQEFGVRHYLLHRGFPDLVPVQPSLDALEFVLGRHPGPNTASFASGVGSRSVTTAYGYNRADWSYIPGGVVSGTGLIRPDLPELKEYPYLWQQTEYVLGGGATNFMFLVLAADQTLGGR